MVEVYVVVVCFLLRFVIGAEGHRRPLVMVCGGVHFKRVER